jgi:hypothetical protein
MQYVLICIYIYMYIYVYVYVCVCIYIYVCVCLYVQYMHYKKFSNSGLSAKFIVRMDSISEL